MTEALQHHKTAPFGSIEEEIRDVARRQAKARKTLWKVGRKAFQGDEKAGAEFGRAAAEVLLSQIFYGEEMRERGLDHLRLEEDFNED